MTLAEFKAWFEGFTESMEGQPTAKQWKRIKERVAQINGVAVTREVIYRDRYWPNIINTSPGVWYGGTISSTCVGQASPASDTVVMSSNMIDLGRAEYNQALAA